MLDGVVADVVARYPRATQVECWGVISDVLRERTDDMFSGDLFHPSPEGHEVFVREVIPAFERAIALAAFPEAAAS